MVEDQIFQLCSILRQRSSEHKIAISRLYDLPAMMASVLRMELDSMVRVIYLLSYDDLSERKRLSQQTLNGQKWNILNAKGKWVNITDKDMVELASKLQGWTQSVYRFGCSFIHLSNFHDYSNSNPFDMLNEKEKNEILSHMRHYHGGPASDTPSFNELARYFPRVFDKISNNLNCYINSLEKNEISRADI